MKKKGYTAQARKKEQIIINQIEIRPVNRQILDIEKWRNALKSADMGRNTTLFDMYEDVLLDGVLGDAIDKRIRAVTGSDLTFQFADGSESEEMINFIDTEEFEYLLQEVLKAKFWGISVIEPLFDGEGMMVYSVPRKHIRKDTQTIAKMQNDPEGSIFYGDNQDVIEVVSREHKHGLILRACPYAIMKRCGIGDWAQMIELFGMPQRIGKYSIYDKEARKALTEAFDSQGAALNMVVPKETEIEVTAQSGNGGGTLYKDFIATLDEQILITILSQTMTTKDGASRSQGQVHKEVEEEVNKADLRFVQRVLNHKLKPILERRGYKVADGSFVFPKALENLTVEQIVSLSNIIEIPAYYIQEKYGIPAAESTDVVAGKKPEKEPEPKGEPEPEPKKKKLFDRFFVNAPTQERGFATRLIDSITGRVTLADDDGDSYSIDLNKLLGEALREVYDGTGNDVVNKNLFKITNDALQQGIDKVFVEEPEFGKKNTEFIEEFRTNTAVFAAFKNHQQTQELVALLHDEDGNLRSFREFKKLALQLSKDYNVNWLQTEYNTAVRAARAAVNYRKWLETEHLYPNLEYIESTASRKRETHLEYVGTILPIRHEWWNTHMPPSGWNCACGVRPTDKPVTPVPNAELVPPVFQNNPGKTVEFVKIEETAYYKGTNAQLKSGVQAFAKNEADIRKKMRRYDGVTFDRKSFRSGGYVEVPVNASQNKQEKKKNMSAYSILGKLYGKKYRLLPVIEDNNSNPDAINMDSGHFSDAKTPNTILGKNAIQNAVKDASRQNVGEVVIHCQHEYSYKDIWEGLKVALQNGRAGNVKTIVMVLPDNRLKTYDVEKLRKHIK